MPVSFTIKAATPKKGSAERSFRNAKQACAAMQEEIQYIATSATVMAVKGAAERTNIQKIYIASMFFQWVVSRTPLDEDYRRANGSMHYADEDVVRDEWHLRYGNFDLCSKDLSGCFDRFNDSTAIDTIASLLSAGIKTNKHIRTFKVYNTNPRFSQLEYGEYFLKHPGKITTGASGRKHGVVDGFSVQAPMGMLRITESELDWIVNQSGMMAKKGLLARAETFRNMRQIPDKRRMKAVYNYIKNKKKVSDSELEVFE